MRSPRCTGSGSLRAASRGGGTSRELTRAGGEENINCEISQASTEKCEKSQNAKTAFFRVAQITQASDGKKTVGNF
jgi:hypothetical protein